MLLKKIKKETLLFQSSFWSAPNARHWNDAHLARSVLFFKESVRIYWYIFLYGKQQEEYLLGRDEEKNRNKNQFKA